MPVVVRELIIKAKVENEPASPGKKTARDKASRSSVAEALEEIMRMIENKNER